MLEFSEVNRSCFLSVRRQQANHDSSPVGAYSVRRWEVKEGIVKMKLYFHCQKWFVIYLWYIMCDGEERAICKGRFSRVAWPTSAEWHIYWQSSLTASTQQAPLHLHTECVSPLFIHSFPRGQVLSLWWMGAGTGQLFSLDGTSLTHSELKRPPCQRSSAMPGLCRGPRATANLSHASADTTAAHLTPPGAFLVRIYLRNWGGCSFWFHPHGSECCTPGGDYGVSSGSLGELHGRNYCGCEGGEGFGAVPAVVVSVLTATFEHVGWLKLVCVRSSFGQSGPFIIAPSIEWKCVLFRTILWEILMHRPKMSFRCIKAVVWYLIDTPPIRFVAEISIKV